MDQQTIKSAASNVQALATSKYRQATNAVDGYVINNPWGAVGVATAVGVLIGFLGARR